jgi:hypothetical protein
MITLVFAAGVMLVALYPKQVSRQPVHPAAATG